MIVANANDYAICLAQLRGTLKIEECLSRFGRTFFAICDEWGTIEATRTREEADALVARAIEREAKEEPL